MTANTLKIRLRIDVSSISSKAMMDCLRDTRHGYVIQNVGRVNVNVIAHMQEVQAKRNEVMGEHEQRHQGSEAFQLRKVRTCRQTLLSGWSKSMCSISPHRFRHTLYSGVWLSGGAGSEKAAIAMLRMSIRSSMSLRVGLRGEFGNTEDYRG